MIKNSAKDGSVVDRLERLAATLPGLTFRRDDLELYRTDIYYVADQPPAAVVTPRTTADVVALVQSALSLGLTLAVRGGGLSYSAGYLAGDDRTLLLDMSGMNAIVALSSEDRYVTVEAGVTWLQLHEALQPLGLTTPFWGTFSGRHATIGGTVSQGGKFYGSASRGSSAESVLALEVVTGTGDVIVTGSAAAQVAASPFFRPYGPDLAGLFLGDCGAFGIKTKITLQLVPASKALGHCSFSFDDASRQLAAMGEIGAELLASECLGMDPFTARSRMASESLVRDIGTLVEIVCSGGLGLGGLRDAASIAWAGRRFADGIGYLMNCVTEGRDEPDAQSKLRRIQAIARKHGGRALPASIPKVMRALPFPPMNGLLTPSAKRMNWLHTVVPNSRGGECFRATEAVFAQHEEAMRKHGIDRGYLLSTHGPNGVGVETLIRWSDAPHAIHLAWLSEPERTKLKPRKANPEAAEAVRALSADVVKAWTALGGIHLQIGRKYPFLETRQPGTASLLRDLKMRFDPDGVLSPGSVVPL